ncbi:flagellar hook-basal body protein [Gorillibacterium sp. sgz5001074]|uniref:flagellar hook-basal body protein n=1 Tax=Gorillibacterium sp. sgz5001074 TaxID=3446695 RepID=UPI003F66F88B
MLRGLYTAAAGMITQQRKHDTITNNISNLNTPGFKQGSAVSRSFPEMLISALGAGAPGVVKNIGKLNTGVLAEEDLSIYLQGDLQETKSPLDVAIVSNIVTDVTGQALPPFDKSGKYVTPEGERIFQPQAFITVQNEQGEERYSRNGKLTVNVEGQLITPEGYKVLDTNGQPILLRDANGQMIANVKILQNGTFLDAVNGQPLLDAGGNPVTLLISRVENPNRMIREGNGVYRLNEEDAATVTPAVMNEEVQVHQGYIERSNVDPTQSMIDMMAALRAYETNQKMVQFYDKSLEKAVNEVGRV